MGGLTTYVKEDIVNSLKDTIKRSLNGYNSFVAIKEIRPGNPDKHESTKVSYRVVTLGEFKNMRQHTKLKVNPETKKIERVKDTIDREVIELGRASTREEARKIINK